MESGPESSCWPFLFVYWYTELLVSAQIVNRVRKNISPDVYSSMCETICLQKLPSVPGWMAKHTKNLGSQNITLMLGQSPLFLWESLEIHFYICEGEQ